MAALELKQADGRIVYFRLDNGIYYPDAESGEDSYITYTSDTYTLIEKTGQPTLSTQPQASSHQSETGMETHQLSLMRTTTSQP